MTETHVFGRIDNFDWIFQDGDPYTRLFMENRQTEYNLLLDGQKLVHQHTRIRHTKSVHGDIQVIQVVNNDKSLGEILADNRLPTDIADRLADLADLGIRLHSQRQPELEVCHVCGTRTGGQTNLLNPRCWECSKGNAPDPTLSPAYVWVHKAYYQTITTYNGVVKINGKLYYITPVYYLFGFNTLFKVWEYDSHLPATQRHLYLETRRMKEWHSQQTKPQS